MKATTTKKRPPQQQWTTKVTTTKNESNTTMTKQQQKRKQPQWQQQQQQQPIQFVNLCRVFYLFKSNLSMKVQLTYLESNIPQSQMLKYDPCMTLNEIVDYVCKKRDLKRKCWWVMSMYLFALPKFWTFGLTQTEGRYPLWLGRTPMMEECWRAKCLKGNCWCLRYFG